MRVTMHCLQVVRFVGETASVGAASGAADAEPAPKTSSENMATMCKEMSDKSTKSLERCA